MSDEVRIVAVDMPFRSMVVFMVKWALAAIPALIILLIIGFVAVGILSTLGTHSAKGTDTPMMDWVLVFPTEEECKKAIPQYEALMNGYDGKCVKIKRQ